MCVCSCWPIFCLPVKLVHLYHSFSPLLPPHHTLSPCFVPIPNCLPCLSLSLTSLPPSPPRPHSAVMTWRRAPYCSAQIIIKHYDVVKFIGHWVLHSNRASRVIQQELEVGWGRSRASDRRQGKEEQMTRRTEDCRDGWNRSNRVMTLTKGELNEQWGKRERNRKVKVCLVKGKRSLAHLACISWFN